MHDIAAYSKTEIYTPAKPPPAKAAKPMRFALVPFDQIEISAGASYLVKGLIPRAGLVVVWGPPKCGKSFLTFDLSMHVALGWEYRGRRVKQGCVVYCALEGAQGFRARVEAFRREKLSGEASSPPFHLMASALNLVADQAAFLEALRAQLGEDRPVVVVIDTLNRSLAGSESDDKDMAAYVRAADAIRDAFDCAVIIVHHCGHNGERPRGHSSLIGAVDAQIAVKRDAAENIIATLELSKDGEAGAEIVSKLVPVEVGTDEDGEPIRSCVIVAVDASASLKTAKGPKLPKGAQIALRALQKAIAEVGATAPASNTVPIGVKAVTVDQWRDYAYRLGISGSSEARGRQIAFQRAHEALIAAKQVGEWDPWAWIV
jgi:AAA domain